MYLNVSIILIALFLGECQIASIFFRGFTFFLWCANIFCYVLAKALKEKSLISWFFVKKEHHIKLRSGIQMKSRIPN